MSEYEHMARRAPYCKEARKAIYPTLEAARVALHIAYQGSRRLRSELLHVYPCEDHFHVGHVSRNHGTYEGPGIGKT